MKKRIMMHETKIPDVAIVRFKMARKRSSTRKRSGKQRGRGLLKDAAKYIKDKKLISKGLLMIPHPAGQVAGQVARMAGLGRPRRSRKRKSAKVVATPRVSRRRVTVSRLVVPPGTVPMTPAAVPTLGRRQRGKGFFSDLGSGIGSVFGGLGHGIGSVAGGLFGRGRGRRTAGTKRASSKVIKI